MNCAFSLATSRYCIPRGFSHPYMHINRNVERSLAYCLNCCLAWLQKHPLAHISCIQHLKSSQPNSCSHARVITLYWCLGRTSLLRVYVSLKLSGSDGACIALHCFYRTTLQLAQNFATAVVVDVVLRHNTHL